MPIRDLFYRKAHGLAIKPNHIDNRDSTMENSISLWSFFLLYKEPFSYNIPLLDIALMSLDINFSIRKTKKNIRSKNAIFNKKVMYKKNTEKDLVGIYMK